MRNYKDARAEAQRRDRASLSDVFLVQIKGDEWRLKLEVLNNRMPSRFKKEVLRMLAQRLAVFHLALSPQPARRSTRRTAATGARAAETTVTELPAAVAEVHRRGGGPKDPNKCALQRCHLIHLRRRKVSKAASDG